ncbi:MAG TPA: ABC transporter permease [Blastocatellia bacterium]|jgi:ABC-2 type transport system permease protein|nr:ABC transporter permease [Blastocatellia bacterium]
MLNKVINIALLHIKLIIIQRSVFFFSLLMPIVFTAIMSQINFGADLNRIHQINVVNDDREEMSLKLISYLQTHSHWGVVIKDRSAALDEVRRGKAIAAVIIPQNFSRAVFKHENIELQTIYDTVAGVEARLAESYVQTAIARLSSSINLAFGLMPATGGPASGAVNDSPDSAASRASFIDALARVDAERQENPAVSIKEEYTAGAAEDVTPKGFAQSSPGMLVMFSLLFLAAGTNIIIHERQISTLRRILIIPGGKQSFIIGKMVGIFVLGIAQMSLLILAGAFLFKVNWGRSPGALILMILSMGIVNTSLGILLATFVRTIEQANAIASLAVMAFSALGGAWWPLEVVPSWMRILGHVLPTAWAMDGFHDIITYGLGITAVLPEASILTISGIIFLGISVKHFRYE